jgi:5-formyltetrahydrofolate cyclo-ligase
MGEHFSLEKQELRRCCLAERRRLPCDQIASNSLAICAQVVRLLVFSHAQHIVSYAALSDEVDPRGIVEAGLDSAKTVYFPRLRGIGLEFLAHRPEELQPGAFGILEPSRGARLADAGNVLFLVPGVAFDPRGARLGRGGGHYDRALGSRPFGFRLGLAAEVQVRAGIPQDDWDQPMDAVVTERRLLWTAAGARDATHTRIEESVR